ncbi:MAG: GNAT family N-acetyltransferase [Lachnospiraceae bacterium]|nr:GNAT family N-acetyltransferase [Lachnospiraceae bacterium]
MMDEERVLETGRLWIRHFRESDVYECWESWGQDESLGKYIVPYPMTNIKQMENLVRGFRSNTNAWVIEDKRIEKIVGYITLDIPYRQTGVGEIGYVIGETHQKQGYAFEAIQSMLEEYLMNRNMYMLEAKCNETNHPSLKLLEKTGFHVDGRLRGRRVDLATGERNDLIVMSMTRDEFMHNKIWR